MKKIFTMITVCAATLAMYTASAGTFPTNVGKTIYSQPTVSTIPGSSNSLRSTTVCDTLVNLTAADSGRIFLWAPPSEGFVSGNGSVIDTTGGTTKIFALTGVGEGFSAPWTGYSVPAAQVFFGVAVIKSTDSAKTVTAYVYDTTGTGAFGGFAPGNAVDSSSVTLKTIAANVTGNTLTQFTFSHQPLLGSKHFFIGVALPQVTGDTLVVVSNQGTTGHGNGWIHAPTAGGWVSYDSLFGAPQGDFIFAVACKTNTGIESVNAGVSNFELFPNPSNGIFTAALNLESPSDVTITVMDITGDKIYESTEVSVKDINKQINLNSAAAGLYFVNVKTATGSVNQRIVIK